VITREQREQKRNELLLASGHIDHLLDRTRIELRAAESEAAGLITAEKRDELLLRVASGVHVEIYLSILAYEQRDGEPNRGFIKLRPSAFSSAAKSAVGRPFLRDHAQAETLATGGKIVASKSEKRGDGDYAINMTVKITAPWAVDMALRDLLSFVSIGLRPVGPVLCSVCGTEVFTQCMHWRGDSIVMKVGEPEQICEWIYTAAEIVEISTVPVPAVVGAHIESIRAELSAITPKKEKQTMDKLALLLAALNLSATASEDEIKTAVEAHNKRANTLEAKLSIASTDLAAAVAERDALRDAKLAADAKAFIDEAIELGKITATDSAVWSKLYANDPTDAVAEMAKRSVGLASPVGRARQTAPAVVAAAAAPGSAPVITGGMSNLHIALTAEDHSADERDRVYAALMSDPRAMHYAAKMWGLRGDGLKVELGATNISNDSDLSASRVGFHAAFLAGLAQKEDDPVQALYTTVPSTGSLEQWNWMGDLPGFDEWKGERKMAGLEAFKLQISNKDWSSGLRIKANDFKDDKLGLLPPQVAGLAMKAKKHRWDMMVKLLANGFAGNVYPEVGNGLGYDGGFFFNTTRATGSNKLTLALDAAGLAAASLLLESMTTYDGNDPLDVHPTHLIVGPKLRTVAEDLLKLNFIPNAAGTATQSNRNVGRYELIVSQRLRGVADDYWFLADLSSPIKPLLFQMREEISTSAQIAPDSEGVFGHNEYRYGAQARYNVAYFEHRLIVGSQVA
jgi:phage major head subunit gpT-like protein